MNGTMAFNKAKKYIQESLTGAGALVGKNVTISSITPIDGGNRVTFSYTLDDGTNETSFMDVMNGIDGDKGIQGLPGKDAFSPIISVEKVERGHKVIITDSTHTEEFIVLDGKDEGGISGIKLAQPTDISLTNQDESVLVKWTDPQNLTLDGVTLAEWAGTIVVRKVGSIPASKFDGTIVVDSKVRNQYKDVGFLDNNLTNDIEYFYGIFPYTTQDVYTTSEIETIIPTEIYPSAVTNVSVSEDDAKLTITYNVDSTVNRVKCVYKEGDTPANSIDGIVIDNFTSGSSITGLTNDITYYFRLYSYNAKNRETVSDAYNGTPSIPLKIVTFANGTDEELEAMLNAHYANKISISDYWAIGDKRDISLNGVIYQFSIIGFTHDDLSVPINNKTKAAVSMQMTNCLNEQYAFNNQTVNGWANSTLRATMNNTMLNWFPLTFKKMIKTVNKKTSVGSGNTNINITQDNLWLISEKEATNSTEYCKAMEGELYTYYITYNNRKKKVLNVDNEWWTRSPQNGGTNERGVFMTSSGSSYPGWCLGTKGVSIGLCI